MNHGVSKVEQVYPEGQHRLEGLQSGAEAESDSGGAAVTKCYELTTDCSPPSPSPCAALAGNGKELGATE